jgi:hypothetical protein
MNCQRHGFSGKTGESGTHEIRKTWFTEGREGNEALRSEGFPAEK